MLEAKLRNTKIEVVQGDITLMNAEAIFCPTDKFLAMRSGLASVLKQVGGVEIEKEVVVRAPAELGGVVLTGAGSLLAKKVFHLVVIENKCIEREVLRKALRDAFRLAEAYEIKSLAIPFLGSPAVMGPADLFARLMLEETVLFIQQNEVSMEKVTFCLYNKEAYFFFVEQLDSLRQIYLF